MSKTPAKKAIPKKPAAKAAAPAKKAAHKAATKPASKPPAKPAPKAAHKPAAKPAHKPAAKAPVKKVPVKAPVKTPIKAAPAPHPHAGAPKPVLKVVAPHPPAPPAKKAPSVRASTRAHQVAPAAAPLPPPTSRFADRFAPPRPPTRQMNNLAVDTPKHTHKADPKLANAWKTKAGRELSEAELLAMPDSEYMNDKQLDFFRARLQALKDDLLSNAGETTEHLREDTSIVPDPADRATIEEEHALELRTRDRERKLLKKISQSLGRIEAGDYGFCDETGEPIGLGRLIARPTATLSLEAQQRRELKQKMFGD
ncbi:RNA polymerase-binding protein DksA [Piscinibacter sp.]|uniref:RNA polymerase-binding protein DksA n=1 Tax=Piscinibacter sp. TaxID=1903157 RepID=UPI002F427578